MVETAEVIGTVVALWRYPVKSMMGEELNAADLTERGVLGDRAYALLDAETGKVAGAKNPREWPNLFDHRASFGERPNSNNAIPPVRITLPDGSVLTSDQPDINRRLSAELGREVTLTAAALSDPELEEYWPNIEGWPTTTSSPMKGGQGVVNGVASTRTGIFDEPEPLAPPPAVAGERCPPD